MTEIITRAQAKALGLKRYFTGKPCKNGHVAERGVSSKTCLICAHKWHVENREAACEYVRKRRAENGAAVRKWAAKNREYLREAHRKWTAENREASRALYHKRRARKQGAEGSYSVADIKHIREQQRNCCTRCGEVLGSKRKDWHIDHKMPLVRGGTNWPSNIQLLCSTCNLEKHARDPVKDKALLKAACEKIFPWHQDLSV